MTPRYDNPAPKWKQSRDRLLSQMAENPKTTVAGFATIAAAMLPKYAIQIGLIATGIGHILGKDGDQGPTKTQVGSDAATVMAEKVAPNAEPRQ